MEEAGTELSLLLLQAIDERFDASFSQVLRKREDAERSAMKPAPVNIPLLLRPPSWWSERLYKILCFALATSGHSVWCNGAHSREWKKG